MVRFVKANSTGKTVSFDMIRAQTVISRKLVRLVFIYVSTRTQYCLYIFSHKIEIWYNEGAA